jgi:1-phosphatidylinositol phosphodiesterase
MEDEMNKNLLKLTALVLSCVVISLLAVAPMQRASANNSDWMKALDDSASLNSLTIPGTHDSGALHSIAQISGKCQSLSIKEQLKVGVRFLDIRLQLVNNELKVVHSFVDQITDFDDVLSDMVEFVRDNKTEFLLVSIKEDADAKRSDINFKDAVEKMLMEYPEVNCSTSLPETVKDARGGIHILARYNGASIGLPCYTGWTDDEAFELGDIYVQDNYRIPNTDEKIADIRSTYSLAMEQKYSLVLNYTSCYLETCFPPIYAGLPAHDINKDTIKALEEYPNGAFGILVCDFMTRELADAIIRRNFV